MYRQSPSYFSFILLVMIFKPTDLRCRMSVQHHDNPEEKNQDGRLYYVHTRSISGKEHAVGRIHASDECKYH
jgi:hypothetical protein